MANSGGDGGRVLDLDDLSAAFNADMGRTDLVAAWLGGSEASGAGADTAAAAPARAATARPGVGFRAASTRPTLAGTQQYEVRSDSVMGSQMIRDRLLRMGGSSGAQRRPRPAAAPAAADECSRAQLCAASPPKAAAAACVSKAATATARRKKRSREHLAL